MLPSMTADDFINASCHDAVLLGQLVSRNPTLRISLTNGVRGLHAQFGTCSAPNVDRLRNHLQMLWVHAGTIAAQMVQLHPLMNGADVKFIHPSVGHDVAVVFAGKPVTIALAPTPNPTPRFRVNVITREGLLFEHLSAALSAFPLITGTSLCGIRPVLRFKHFTRQSEVADTTDLRTSRLGRCHADLLNRSVCRRAGGVRSAARLSLFYQKPNNHSIFWAGAGAQEEAGQTAKPGTTQPQPNEQGATNAQQ